MTEAEWNACTDPQPMLEFLRGRVSERKLRLFAVACCRLFWDSFTHERSRRAVDAAERHADNPLPEDERFAIQRAAVVRVPSKKHSRRSAIREVPAWVLSEGALVSAQGVLNRTTYALGEKRGLVPSLLRCIFRPRLQVPFAAGQLASLVTVPALAHAIYADRAFDRMPILADALEEAGCINQDIIEHCRGPGPHVRGCWVVDLLLGKE